MPSSRQQRARQRRCPEGRKARPLTTTTAGSIGSSSLAPCVVVASRCSVSSSLQQQHLSGVGGTENICDCA